MSPFLGQARPFCTNLPWFCRFFGPPSANLQSKGSEGASKRKHTQLLGHGAVPTPPVAPSPGPRGLTCYSRGRLYILSIKVGDDGFTFLCGLHPKMHIGVRPPVGICVRHISSDKTQAPRPTNARECLCHTRSFPATSISTFLTLYSIQLSVTHNDTSMCVNVLGSIFLELTG